MNIKTILTNDLFIILIMVSGIIIIGLTLNYFEDNEFEPEEKIISEVQMTNVMSLDQHIYEKSFKRVSIISLLFRLGIIIIIILILIFIILFLIKCLINYICLRIKLFQLFGIIRLKNVKDLIL